MRPGISYREDETMTSLTTFAPEPTQLSTSPIGAEQLRVVVELGRQLPQIAALGKLAILHSDTGIADTAILLAEDMTVTARQIGTSNDERNHLERLAVVFGQQLEQELSASAIALRQDIAIGAFLDREDESPGSPD